MGVINWHPFLLRIHEMHITAKPTSFNCNIKCDYCFYLEKEALFEPQSSPTMSDESLELFIKHYIKVSGEDVYFTWQGGEPTLAGLPFFEKAIELQKQYANGKTIHNAMQTNGILLNDRWGLFLKEHDFLVGISIDGPKELHDIYRVTGSGRGTFEKVMAGIDVLNRHSIPFNTLTVINNENVKHPLKVYNFLKSLGTEHIQFIELLETETFSETAIPIWLVDEERPSIVTNFSTPALEYGHFMKAIFKEWVANDVGTIFVRQFESFLSKFVGAGHTSCIFQADCGDSLVVESDGTIYECDHYVYPSYEIGNVKSGLDNVHGHQVSKAKRSLAEKCLKCDYLEICNGGCPKHRINTGNGAGVSYFCEGYKVLYKEMIPYMNAMVSLIESGQPAWNVMHIVDKIRH